MIKKTYTVQKEDFQNAGKASSDIKKVLQELYTPKTTLRKIAVACYEAEINLIIHANGGTIELLVEDEVIKLTFVDDGPGIADIEQAMQPGYSTASKKARDLGFGAGMGLYNIKRVSDEFSISSSPNGTTLKIGFKVEE